MKGWMMPWSLEKPVAQPLEIDKLPKSSEEKLAVIRERAFSKVIWGEKDLDVIRFLRTQ
ncbi:hypothetical protein OAE25_02785 [Verrucomicrobiales bacterium]|nr:hypothetical protein [Verrucomicrobiales bacterium]